MSDTAPTKSGSGLLTALAVLGGFVIFVVILLIVYVPRRPAPAGDGIQTPAKRAAILAKLREQDEAAANNYAWVDQAKGVVRLPIDRAMALTLRDIEARQQEKK